MRRNNQVLDSFPLNAQGKRDASDAADKYAAMIVEEKAQSDFGVSIKQMTNELGQRVYAVVLVER